MRTSIATRPAKPLDPNDSMIVVKLPITFTPKTPLPKRTSDIAPTATKDGFAADNARAYLAKKKAEADRAAAPDTAPVATVTVALGGS